MRDHEPVTIDRFWGDWSRGEDEAAPKLHTIDSLNVRYFEGGVRTREGSTNVITVSSVVRTALYKKIGEAPRLLILDNTGKLYDSTNLVTPILNIVAMTDFGSVTMFDRAYITPHNGVRGLPGEKVYVYDGTTCRPAAGAPPSGSSLVCVDSAQSGNVEAGKHYIAVAFQTISGFITKPGPTLPTMYTAPGNFKLNVSNIPVGPAGTYGRYLLATKVVADTYTGSPWALEYFFIPNGLIANNTATSLNDTINFYDADLQASADYLYNEMSEIPAGAGITTYRGRLVIYGPNTADSLALVSRAGEPESVNSLTGSIAVTPGDVGGGIKAAVEFRTQLYFLKSQRTLTTSDNGAEPAYWSVNNVDDAVGCETHGIAAILDTKGAANDYFFVADRSGLKLFNGMYDPSELSDKIADKWDRINKAYFGLVEIALDPIKKHFYIVVPLDSATSPSHILHCDYNDGLSADKVKWTTWTFPNDPSCIVVDVDYTTKVTVPMFGSVSGNVRKMDPSVFNDYGTLITSYVKFWWINDDKAGGILHFNLIRLLVRGAGALGITLSSKNDTIVKQAASLVLAASPGTSLQRGINFVSEGMHLKLGVSTINHWFSLTRAIVFASKLWESRPGT